VARIVADRLGWRLLDTGAMYRAVALAAIRAGLDLADERAVGALADRLTVALPPGRVLLDGQDVTTEIRSIEVTRVTRFAADNPIVRRRLAAWQREFAAENDTITEGRDQGTIVFPDAPCKFFLTADPAERARRRHAEFQLRGEAIALEQVLLDQQERDARDASRAIAPLRPADDARLVDTTGRTIEEVAAIIEAAARSCLADDLLPPPESPVQ
jgi:cytidylate kinase